MTTSPSYVGFKDLRTIKSEGQITQSWNWEAERVSAFRLATDGPFLTCSILDIDTPEDFRTGSIFLTGRCLHFRLNIMNKSPSIVRVGAGSAGQRPQRRRNPHQTFSYFTEFTYTKGILYAAVSLYVVAVCVVVVLELVLTDAAIQCDKSEGSLTEQQRIAMAMVYTNPSFHYDPCRYMRRPALLWLTRNECSFGRRLLSAVLLGGIVGWERREADRPAGIRTMSLVSLGACLFSINSSFGFIDGPMEWDASRVSAAIPSGVGFLGAGLIFKEADKDKVTGDTTHVVHGLTTAASLWIVSTLFYK